MENKISLANKQKLRVLYLIIYWDISRGSHKKSIANLP